VIGKETLATRLLAHFGSLKALAKVSACELGAFMANNKAERLLAALAVSARAQAQIAFQQPFYIPEMVYRSCLDMQAELLESVGKRFHAHFAIPARIKKERHGKN